MLGLATIARAIDERQQAARRSRIAISRCVTAVRRAQPLGAHVKEAVRTARRRMELDTFLAAYGIEVQR
jgi:hypothetical protein